LALGETRLKIARTSIFMRVLAIIICPLSQETRSELYEVFSMVLLNNRFGISLHPAHKLPQPGGEGSNPFSRSIIIFCFSRPKVLCRAVAEFFCLSVLATNTDSIKGKKRYAYLGGCI